MVGNSLRDATTYDLIVGNSMGFRKNLIKGLVKI